MLSAQQNIENNKHLSRLIVRHKWLNCINCNTLTKEQQHEPKPLDLRPRTPVDKHSKIQYKSDFAPDNNLRVSTRDITEVSKKNLAENGF